MLRRSMAVWENAHMGQVSLRDLLPMLGWGQGELEQLMACLARRHDGLSLDPQCPCEKPRVKVCMYNPNAMKEKIILRACSSASLAQSVSSRLHERPCLKKISVELKHN